jgi:hypothetical protein
VNYAVRSLFGNVLRLRTGAVFLAVAALGIFVSGCNKGQVAQLSQLSTFEPVKCFGISRG